MEEALYEQLKELGGGLGRIEEQHKRNVAAIEEAHALRVDELESANRQRQQGIPREMTAYLKELLLTVKEDAEDAEDARYREERSEFVTAVWRVLPTNWTNLRPDADWR